MSKTEDNTDMKILKTSTYKTLPAKSTLTYQVGSNPDDTIHVRITKNTGGGFFSDEWISMKDIQAILDEHPAGTPVTSFILYTLFKGRSVNTPAFLLAALANEKLLYPMNRKKRSLEPTQDFTAMVEKMTSLSSSAKKKVTTKRPTKKAATEKVSGTISRKATVRKKAAIKKKALSRKKTTKTV